MDSLSYIAKNYATDKYGHHSFTPIYDFWMNKWVDTPIVLLELGIGGYEYPDRGGGSLEMWRDYFSRAKIVGVDLYNKQGLNIKGVDIRQGSQLDEAFLKSLINEIGVPDAIIDDASHINNYTIATFEILFPLLKSGGLYFIEDCHTSYWKENYNGDENYNNNHSVTVMNYFHRVSHYLNREHLIGSTPNYDDVKGIHFYKEMIVISKV